MKIVFFYFINSTSLQRHASFNLEDYQRDACILHDARRLPEEERIRQKTSALRSNIQFQDTGKMEFNAAIKTASITTNNVI